MSYVEAISEVPIIDEKLYSVEEDKLHIRTKAVILALDEKKDPKRVLIDDVLKLSMEALYNLEYFNPYLKDYPRIQYAEIFTRFQHLEDDKKDEFLVSVTNHIRELKHLILKENVDDETKKIMPLMHIVMLLVTYFYSRRKFYLARDPACSEQWTPRTNTLSLGSGRKSLKSSQTRPMSCAYCRCRTACSRTNSSKCSTASGSYPVCV